MYIERNLGIKFRATIYSCWGTILGAPFIVRDVTVAVNRLKTHFSKIYILTKLKRKQECVNKLDIF